MRTELFKRTVVKMFLVLLCVFLVGNSPLLQAQDHSAKLWEPITWEYDGPLLSNPFDIEVTATFTHTGSGTQIVTHLFYDGGVSWKLRFTGTETGNWSYITSCPDSSILHGQNGTITINEPDDGDYGFIVADGNKWARQVWKNNTSNKEVFIPQYLMYRGANEFHDNELQINTDITEHLDNQGFNGFHTVLEGRWFNIAEAELTEIIGVGGNDLNPDIDTFEALESLIKTVHERGYVVHIWGWGRYSNPGALGGGHNGFVDRRLQKYICARLGALPGWSFGYGWDCGASGGEPNSFSNIQTWHTFMEDYNGWSSYTLLGARNAGIDYDSFTDYHSNELHRPDNPNLNDPDDTNLEYFHLMYNYYIEKIDVFDKPVFFADRWRHRTCSASWCRRKNFNEDMTRRGLWYSVMAGGVANIWGNEDGREMSFLYSGNEANGVDMVNEIQIYSEFWKDRFVAELQRDTDRNEVGEGVCLKKTDNSFYVFYQDNTTSIATGVTDFTNAIAVNTKAAAYIEIPVTIDTDGVIRNLPLSDWAVALGDPNKSITVTAPNGGESWELGSTHDITWSASGLTNNVKITLWDGETFIGIIHKDVAPSSGSFSWEVGKYYTNSTDYLNDDFTIAIPGTGYTIKIREQGGAAFLTQDSSDNSFGISQLSVFSPNGSESWQIGSTHDITWSAVGLTNNVKITLWNGETFIGIIQKDVAPSSGSFSWEVGKYYANSTDYLNNISAIAAPGTDYKINIREQGGIDYTTLDNSDDSFTLTPPSITVTSPNGGESRLLGNPENITWEAVGLTNDVKITLWKDGIFVGIIQKDVEPLSGSFLWEVGKYYANSTDYLNDAPAIAVPGTDYTIKVREQGGVEFQTQDVSDANFEIFGPEIRVISPNGTENLIIGSRENITWFARGLTNTVKITLWKDDIFVGIIQKDVEPLSGSFSWDVGKHYASSTDYLNGIFAIASTGTGYKIYIREQGGVDYTTQDDSDAPFTLVVN